MFGAINIHYANSLNFNVKTTSPVPKKGTRLPVSHLSWMLIVCMFCTNSFWYFRTKEDLRSEPSVVTTTLFSTHFPQSMIPRIGAFTSSVFWYSTKSLYTKTRVMPEMRLFGKSPRTLSSPKSSFPMWMPKGVSLPRKTRILGMFLLGNVKPAFALNSSSTLPSSRIRDAPVAQYTKVSNKVRRVRYKFFCTAPVSFFLIKH